MSISGFDPDLVPVEVTVDDVFVRVRLKSGIKFATPVARFPRLQNATPEQQRTWRLIGRGDGIHWPDIDEQISMRGLLDGHLPIESAIQDVA
jgi:hypothetical protein